MGFSFKKLGRAVSSGVKTITKPLAVPVNIAKDVQKKGLVKGLKAIPSRIHVDAIKAGVDFTADSARALGVGGKVGAKIERTAVKAIEGSAKLQTWTQRRPVQTMIGAAAVGGAGYAAFVAAPAALAGGGGAAAAGGGGAAAASGSAAGGTSVLASMGAAAAKAGAGLAISVGAKYARTAVGKSESGSSGLPATNPEGGDAALADHAPSLLDRLLALAFPGIR